MNKREQMMELAGQVNELRANIKAARGNKRATLELTLATLLPELHAAQRAYLAERRSEVK